MAVAYNQQEQLVYYHFTTTNQSFLDIHEYLKSRGITNNKFHLILYDKDLASIDPYDPRLNMNMKIKITRECARNYWYFIRCVVRVPTTGFANGVPYILDRGNLAMSYCACLNINIFFEEPRQVGKTTSSLIWYLWLHSFGTINSEISFLHKRLEDAEYNLNELKKIRDLLPSYLIMSNNYNADGTKSRVREAVRKLKHPVNNNTINTVASARSKTAAASLLRGRTIPLLYADEWAFTPHNETVYVNMIPAFNTAAHNSKLNRKPYGIIISTTPGLLVTDEGQYAFKMKELATKFDEQFYNLNYDQLQDLLKSNTKSSFIHIKYTYQQLGKSEEWFESVCRNIGMDWPTIRREILLEWAQTTDNSPFRIEDLEIIKTLIKQPIQSWMILNKYIFNVYEKVNLKHPPLVGVDVSGGYQRDSTAITIVDSYSTRVTADLNSNNLSPIDLAAVLIELVKFMPNCVINIERTGGYGTSTLAKLVNSPIKQNLFYTIKDKIIEERINGAQISKRTQKTKVYGMDATHESREKLMVILRDRIDYHKDKIISPIIYEELCGLEVQKSGRIQHSLNTHDDQVFSWLWALYMYYEGTNLVNNWGIIRRVLKTDVDLEEAIYDINGGYIELNKDIEIIDNDEIRSQLEILEKGPGKLMYEEWMNEEFRKDKEAMDAILSTKIGREAYNRQYNIDTSVEDEYNIYSIPDTVFTDFYKDDIYDRIIDKST